MPRMIRSVSAPSRRRAMTHSPIRLPVVNKRPIAQVVHQFGRPISINTAEACVQEKAGPGPYKHGNGWAG
jgi:hypothetical protein